MDLAPAFAVTGRGRLAVAGGGCDDGVAGIKRRLADFGGLCCPARLLAIDYKTLLRKLSD